MGERLWECQRVRAGPLVKELRMQRPRRAADDTPEDRREKSFIRSRCALLRDPTDRLEIRLALLGIDAVHYTLTFDDARLPERYADVAAVWQAFAKRCKRHHGGAFDFVKCIEGIHGDHRWHIHFCCRSADFNLSDVCRLWGCGHVAAEQVVLDFTAFRRLARYFRKERRDGQRLPLDKQPLTWSASLRIPPVERWKEPSGVIPVPKDARIIQRPSIYQNPFGGFAYCSYYFPGRKKAGRCTGIPHAF